MKITPIFIFVQWLRLFRPFSWWLLAVFVVLLSIVVLAIRRRRQPREVSEARSYLYVGLWVYWYKIKTDYLPVLVAIGVFILSLVEIFGPLTHFLPEQAMGVRISIVVGLLLSAIFLLWHHSHLKSRIKQYETVIGSVRVVLEDADSPADQGETSPIIRILDAMVFALQCERKKVKINGVVLARTIAGESPFRIYAQDSDNNFGANVTVHARESVAGKVIEAEQKHKRCLLYVPSVRYKHAVLIALEKRGDDQVFQTTKVVPAAYAPPVGNGGAPNILESLLCVQVPISENGVEAKHAVFSLSAHKANRMGALDFAVARMAAVLLGRTLDGKAVLGTPSQPPASK